MVLPLGDQLEGLLDDLLLLNLTLKQKRCHQSSKQQVQQELRTHVVLVELVDPGLPVVVEHEDGGDHGDGEQQRDLRRRLLGLG